MQAHAHVKNDLTMMMQMHSVTIAHAVIAARPPNNLHQLEPQALSPEPYTLDPRP